MASGKRKILAISGSTRKGSTNDMILNLISALYEDSLEVEVFDGIDKLPHFNPDLDTESPPILVKDLRDKIQSYDGVIICTPEYVFSPPRFFPTNL